LKRKKFYIITPNVRKNVVSPFQRFIYENFKISWGRLWLGQIFGSTAIQTGKLLASPANIRLN
jgi:hypothetical protein